MRVIPILKSDGNVDDCLVGIVQACMMYPDDVPSIEEDISAYRLRSASGFRDTQLGRRLNADFQSAKLGECTQEARFLNSYNLRDIDLILAFRSIELIML